MSPDIQLGEDVRVRSQLAAPTAIFASGLLLWLAVVYLIGVGAAVAIPRSYLHAFGESRRLAMLLADIVLLAAPAFLLSATWTAATAWPARTFLRQAAKWFLAGMATSWAWFLAVSVIGFVAMMDDQSSAAAVLKILLVLALPSEPGSMPTYAAPWVGVAVGLWCVQRVNLSLASRRSSSAA